MFENRKKSITVSAAIAATALTLLAGSGAASATTINWKGVTFETQGSGGATIDSNDNLLLNPTGDSFSLHVNRLPGGGNSPSPINANDTPFISFSYFDTGVASEYIDVAVQDETASGKPRVAAGSLFSATQAAFGTYGTGAERDANEDYLFFTEPREAVAHSVTLGKTVDSTFYTTFDGEQRSSDIFKDQGIDFDFNDVVLRARHANGSTIRFTDFAFGDDFSPASLQDVPEPSSFAMFGLGAILLLAFGSVRTRRT